VGPVPVLDEGETVVENFIVRAQIEEPLEESAKVSGGIEVIQRVPVVLASEGGFRDLEIEKGL
jgi:hypothetical protein